MNTNLFIIFIIANILNVVLNTAKSLCTINGGKLLASVMNAITYGFYTYVIVLTSCNLPMLTKCIIVGSCNFIGVYIVKLVEEKMRKDKLWKIEVTIPKEEKTSMLIACKENSIAFNYYSINTEYTGFNFYCYSKEESNRVKELLKHYNAKYFVSESKIL